MRFRNTVILFIVFAALGGYVYYSDFRNPDAKRKVEDAKRKVFQFEGKDINEIRVVVDGATVTGVRKDEKNWGLTNPTGIEADSGEWDALASHIAGLEREKSIDENAKDLKPFGLDKPAVQLFARRKDGTTVEIGIGDENPSKTLRYVKLSTSGEVFLSPNSITSFRKSLTDLRDKTAVDVLPENIDRFVIVDGAKLATFKKSGEHWRIETTGAAAVFNADDAEIQAFLGAVQFARATEFVDTSAASFDMKKNGLEPPALQLTLHDTKANVDRTLIIGRESAPDKFYAKDAARPFVFILEKVIPEKLRRPLFDWRDKSIAKFERDKLDEIEIVRGADKLVLKKTGTDWKLADSRKVQPDKVLAMLDILDFERAKDFVDAAAKPPAGSGLDKPRLQATLRQGGKDIVGLAFGSDSTKPEGIYLRKAEGPVVMVVSKDVYDKLNFKADDIVEKADPLPAAAPVKP